MKKKTFEKSDEVLRWESAAGDAAERTYARIEIRRRDRIRALNEVEEILTQEESDDSSK